MNGVMYLKWFFKILETIGKVITKNGGTILVRAEVNEIIIKIIKLKEFD